MKRKPFLPLRWVIYLLLLTMLATGVSLSRYKTTVAGSGTVSVARPVVEFSNNSAVTIAGMLPGEIRDFEFSVTNRGQNEVTMKYALGVVTPDGWPISAVILRGNGAALSPAEWEIMNYSSEETKHGYTLRLTWDASAPGSASSTNMGQTWSGLKIHLDAVQVD
jgi:hypothetical protein